MSLEKAKIKAEEIEINNRKKFEEELSKLKKEYEKKEAFLEKKYNNLIHKIDEDTKKIDEKSSKIKFREKNIKIEEEEISKLKDHYERKIKETISILEKNSGLTVSEAREIILQKTKEQSINEISAIIRKYEKEANEEAKKKANFIIAQATSRYAGEFASEKLVNIVNLPNEELKGRIIGKEGRNIKTLESLLGVDIIIDETPNAIILSSFNIYRRSIASKTLEKLIEDGRIQPAKIEEIYQKTLKEFEQSTLEEGENIVYDLGINDMHPELIKLIGKLRFRASYGQNALEHSLEVCHLAGMIATQLGGDEKLAKRAGILHDIGKALTQDLGGNHVDLGVDICRRYNEHEVVINAIYAHHGYEEAKSIECAAVCTGDALSAARPGARREVLESFLKRVEEIEKIALSKIGVKQAYAINAGREIRVIANSNSIKEDEIPILAREIAKEIEASVQYPGEIKVNIIRETRVVEFAR